MNAKHETLTHILATLDKTQHQLATQTSATEQNASTRKSNHVQGEVVVNMSKKEKPLACTERSAVQNLEATCQRCKARIGNASIRRLQNLEATKSGGSTSCLSTTLAALEEQLRGPRAQREPIGNASLACMRSCANRKRRRQNKRPTE